MSDDDIQDLKLFISKTVSQEASEIKADMTGLKSSIKADIRSLDIKLSTKIDDLSAYIADTIDMNNDVGSRLKNHDTRIKRLERKAA